MPFFMPLDAIGPNRDGNPATEASSTAAAPVLARPRGHGGRKPGASVKILKSQGCYDNYMITIMVEDKNEDR
jgi:hypothetical protein